jgi:hypothetical protein
VYGGDTQGIPKNYTLTISKSTGNNTISLGNLNDSGQSLTATVIGSTMTLNMLQTLNGKSIQGTGGIVNNVLAFTTTVDISGPDKEVWTQTATKK